MEIVLEKMNGKVYAMDPQIEKIQGQNRMRLAYTGCTHILLLYAFLEHKIDFLSEDMHERLKSLQKEVLSGESVRLPETDMMVKMVDFLTLQKNKGNIQLPDIAANYAVCACRYRPQQDIMTLYLPDRSSLRYQATVSVEIKYKVEPYILSVKKGFLGLGGMESRRTEYFRAVIGTEKSNFQSGDIVYTINKEPYRYPITKEMKGKELLIKSSDGIPPKFQATVPGITLKEG